MSIVVEDGTGKADAESFCSVSDFRAYHSKRGTDTTAIVDATVEGLLVKATDYMQTKYSDRWRGVRRKYEQALDWPRAYSLRSESDVLEPSSDYYWWSVDSVPTSVKNACAELALRANTSDLLPDVGRRTVEETVGPITVKYADSQAERETTEYPLVDSMLRRLLCYDDGITGDMVRG